MKASDITQDMVRAAIEKSVTFSENNRPLTTEQVLDSRSATRGPARRARRDTCARRRTRRRGRRGYRWRWITPADRDAGRQQAEHDARYRALAERIARRVGDERSRALAEVGGYEPVDFRTYSNDEDRLDGHIRVNLNYDSCSACPRVSEYMLIINRQHIRFCPACWVALVDAVTELPPAPQR